MVPAAFTHTQKKMDVEGGAVGPPAAETEEANKKDFTTIKAIVLIYAFHAVAYLCISVQIGSWSGDFPVVILGFLSALNACSYMLSMFVIFFMYVRAEGRDFPLAKLGFVVAMNVCAYITAMLAVFLHERGKASTTFILALFSAMRTCAIIVGMTTWVAGVVRFVFL